jgi:hypothetical protein
MAKKDCPMAPYQIDPRKSFELVAAKKEQLRQAEKEERTRRAAHLEAKNAVKRLNEELSSVIDSEADPRPNLFTHLIKPAAPTAADIAREPVQSLGLNQKDTECLVGNKITTVGELNAARLKEGGLDEKKFGKAFLGRLEKKLTAFMAARHMGQVAKPTEQPATPKAEKKAPRGRKKKAEAEAPKLAEGTEAEPAAVDHPAA